jgi:hypothetical protein
VSYERSYLSGLAPDFEGCSATDLLIPAVHVITVRRHRSEPGREAQGGYNVQTGLEQDIARLTSQIPVNRVGLRTNACVALGRAMVNRGHLPVWDDP